MSVIPELKTTRHFLHTFYVQLNEYWKSLTIQQRKELQDKLGVSRVHLYYLRTKKKKPSLELALKIQSITRNKVRVEELL